ncbi:Hse1p [Rhizophagus irregularis DAOM 197198w]|nr:Hse1p [Rhizophagus irregularis DAOM 197198w]
MNMRPSSQPQSNRNSQQQQGPGDIRRLSNTNSSSPTLTQVPQQGGYQQQQIQGQMISQDQIPTQGNNNNNNNNSSNLNRSDTLRTTSTNSSNNSLGIQLDVLGRVKQDDLAESFVINGGRLPPESARFQMNSQGIPQGVQQQISSQGQISPQGQQVYQHNNYNLPINQSSFRGQPQQVVRQQQIISPQIQQQVQQQQLNRSNTLNSNSTLTSAFHHQQQQGNPRTTLQGSVSVQQQQQPLVGGQLAGQPQHQLNFQDQNFYTGPIMAQAQYQRPPVGGGANVQGFQQIQQVPQQHHLHRQLPQFGLQQSLQPMARGIQLQYGHQPILQRSIIPIDNRQRTEDGKPIEFYVKALYDYQKTIPEEISFTANDVIAVLNTHSDGWWEGEILDETRRNRGLFPSNYTEILR